MRREAALALGVAALAAVGVGVAVYLRRRRGGAEDAPVKTASGGGGRVLHRDRARGVHPSLLALLDAWEAEGDWDVQVAPNGGLRTDAAVQASLASSGQSGATTLNATPHGRGAALDVWPLGFEAHVAGPWAAVPQALREKFAGFGAWAESKGFVWLGHPSQRFPHGDQPHVQLAHWRQLPFPPPLYV